MTLSRAVLRYSSTHSPTAGGDRRVVPAKDLRDPAQDACEVERAPEGRRGLRPLWRRQDGVKGDANKYRKGQSLGPQPVRPAFGFRSIPCPGLVTYERSLRQHGTSVADCDLTSPAAETTPSWRDVCGAWPFRLRDRRPGATYYPDTLADGAGDPSGTWDFAAFSTSRAAAVRGLRLFPPRLATSGCPKTPRTRPSDTAFRNRPRRRSALPGGGGTRYGAGASIPTGSAADTTFSLFGRVGKQIDTGTLRPHRQRQSGPARFFQGVVSSADERRTLRVVAQFQRSFVCRREPRGLAPCGWQQYCHYETPMLPEYKMLGVYTVPRAEVQISAAFKSVPGPELAANYVLTSAMAAQTLGRPLSGGAANMTVNLVQPGSLYGDRHNPRSSRGEDLQVWRNTYDSECRSLQRLECESRRRREPQLRRVAAADLRSPGALREVRHAVRLLIWSCP